MLIFMGRAGISTKGEIIALLQIMQLTAYSSGVFSKMAVYEINIISSIRSLLKFPLCCASSRLNLVMRSLKLISWTLKSLQLDSHFHSLEPLC